MERFLRDLMIDPNVGMGDNGDDENEDEYWDGGGGYGNAYYEYSRGGLVKRANGWATEEDVGATGGPGLTPPGEPTDKRRVLWCNR